MKAKRCIIVFDQAGFEIAMQKQNVQVADKLTILGMLVHVNGANDMVPVIVNVGKSGPNYEPKRGDWIVDRMQDSGLSFNQVSKLACVVIQEFDDIIVIEPRLEHALQIALDSDTVNVELTDIVSRSCSNMRNAVMSLNMTLSAFIFMLTQDRQIEIQAYAQDTAYTALAELALAGKYHMRSVSIRYHDKFVMANLGMIVERVATKQEIDTLIAMPGFKDIFSNLNQMRDATFKVATDTHRYDSKPGIADVLMHTIGEATEAHTALAANKHAKQEDLDLLLQQLEQGKDDMFKKLFKLTVKSTFEDELADLLLMVLSMAGYYGVDLSTHVAMKCKYNSLRDEHSDVSDYSNNH